MLLCCGLVRWSCVVVLCGVERVGLDFGREGCSIFYLEVTGEAVLIRKTEVEET